MRNHIIQLKYHPIFAVLPISWILIILCRPLTFAGDLLQEKPKRPNIIVILIDAMRSGDWKFLMQFDGTKPQLYDLKADPSERRNIAVEHPDLIETFSRQLHESDADVSQTK